MSEMQARWTETRCYFYQDASGQGRWDAVGADGAVIAQSSVSFKTRLTSVQNALEQGYAAPRVGVSM